ncbi:alpha/beta fold hydrolase [Ferrimonas marina]|uniref:Alpha/beta hydrolase fold n=1 Tax=Ferrimonas marina TaxID=299255 RepID=A0A1M5RDE5_9GAMM|nr:alpha/beta hydrolase [Ferrimonas marina]SHH24324.1 alpha/beta hydrolase fold [Ferrimonas marina]
MDFTEATVKVNGVEIAYQLHGESNRPTLLLIHGLSVPLTGWPTEMVQSFIALGYQVLLLDNRDIGRSGPLNIKTPNLAWALLKRKLGFKSRAPYRLEDMMADTVALLDALRLDKVHVVGASMGGMIAQLMAIHHPERLLTLTSIMSTTGYRALPPINTEVKRAIFTKPASPTYEGRFAYHINLWRTIGSPAYPVDTAELENRVAAMMARGMTSKGTLRQMFAVIFAADRTEQLEQVTTPTLVLHGESDGLVNCDGGRETAKAIPNAKLKTYPGMGHDFPPQLLPAIVGDIAAHCQLNQHLS